MNLALELFLVSTGMIFFIVIVAELIVKAATLIKGQDNGSD